MTKTRKLRESTIGTMHRSVAPVRECVIGRFFTPESRQSRQDREARRLKREDQRRTVIAKRTFLEVFAKTMGTITVACEKAGVGRATYYEWLDTDPQFRKAVDRVKATRIDMAEDRLFKLIQNDDGPSVRYFLDRQAPQYKPTSKTEIVTGDETFEDLLYKQALARKEAEEAAQKKDHGPANTTTEGITAG